MQFSAWYARGGQMRAEFDGYANSYRKLLREPIRERFARDPRFYTERKGVLSMTR